VGTLRHLILEVHRRSLWQVLGVYMVGAWVAYQVILDLVEGLQLPPWLPGMAVVLFLIGLPIVVAAAMVQDRPAEAGEGEAARDEVAGPPAGPVGEVETTTGMEPTPRVGDARPAFPWVRTVPAGVAALAVLVVVAGVVGAVAIFGASGAGDGVVAAGVNGASPPTAGSASPAREAGAAGVLAIVTEPAGARVRLVPVVAGEAVVERVHDAGETPLEMSGLGAGEYLIEVGMAGHHPLELLARVAEGEATSVRGRLIRDEGREAAMVFVERGPVAGETSEAGPLLMDRFEVTNAQYGEFVAAGGYADRRLWPDTMRVDGEPRPWAVAIRTFVDRTGLPGPRGWSGGIAPAGQADHPVVGVSWYEASAYARWAGKELPGWADWWRAALGDGEAYFPWGEDMAAVHGRANFGLEGTMPVGSFPLGISPFGAHDMAGNVREWLRDAPPAGPAARRLVVGAGWTDPDYMFEPGKAEAFEPDFSSDVIGFRCMRPVSHN
jgi:formylglycine-generating enzyme required for sulfatase activity